MNILSLLVLLAAPAPAPARAAADSDPVVQVASPAPGTIESSKIKLDAQDAAGALSDAEIALQKGGGAAAYAARADAKRALGGREDEAIADYAAAAKLDPRYIEKYEGLIAQKQSELHPDKTNRGGKGLNGVPVSEIAVFAAVGAILLFAGGRLLRRREDRADSMDNDDPTPKAPAKAELPKA